jgi:small subunit ribosomal protein S4
MGNYCGPKVRLSRGLGVPIAETVKHMNLRRPNRPGTHGYRRARQSLYGRQLAEKQKLAAYYNVRNHQMVRYMKEATAAGRSTPEVFQEILESRLDNVIRRLGWARTIWQARQMVAHGHFQINGQKTDRPSFRVRPDDVISVRQRSEKFIKESTTQADAPMAPEWLSMTEGRPEARVLRLPNLEDVRLPFEVNYNMIIEFYTR